MRPIVQISLDLIDRAEALATAETALRAGVDWLEAGTPFILAEGVHGVRALRERFFDCGIDGAMSRVVRVPCRCLHRVPTGLAREHAALTKPGCIIPVHGLCADRRDRS